VPQHVATGVYMVRSALCKMAELLLLLDYSQEAAAQIFAKPAEQRIGSLPLPGHEQVATVGSPIFERFRYAVRLSAIPEQSLHRSILLSDLRIAAGAVLTPVQSNAKFKACDGYGACAFDDDGDGTFDRIAHDSSSSALRLAAPVKYEMREVIVPAANNFRQVTLFLGTANESIRLSYREFANDLARPAFTEEMTFPVPRAFPATLAFKDVKLLVSGIDSAGIHYRVEP